MVRRVSVKEGGESMKYFKTSQWLAENLENDKLQIIEATVLFNKDKPGTEEFLKSGYSDYLESHIPGAIFVDQFQLSRDQTDIPFTPVDHQQFLDTIAELGINPEKDIIIYDRGSMVNSEFKASYWASRLAWQLLYEGFKNVSVLEGGWEKWLSEKRPTSEEISQHTACEPSSIQRCPHYIADRQEVLEATKSDQVLLIDALTFDQYVGDMAPFGPDRAGHIPGAMNMGFDTVMDHSKLELVDINIIREKLLELGLRRPDHRAIVYCGFGVAATWIWLLLLEMDYQNIAIYDGSLTDWALFSDLPLEVGP